MIWIYKGRNKAPIHGSSVMCTPLVFAIGIAIVLLVMFIYIRLGPSPVVVKDTSMLPTTFVNPISVYTLTDPETLLVEPHTNDDSDDDSDDDDGDDGDDVV
jgi:hypothetical protein